MSITLSDEPRLVSGRAAKVIMTIVVLFSMVGLGLLVGACLATASRVSFLSRAVHAEGTVTALISTVTRRDSGARPTYYPLVEFTDATGVTVQFRGDNASRPPAYDQGETVAVRYIPTQPGLAKIDSFYELWLWPLILGLMGIIFSAIGFGGLIGRLRYLGRVKHAKQNGQRISADLTAIDLDRSIRMNGRSPYRLNAQWQDPMTKKMYSFKSEDFWFDPTAFVKTKKVDVLIDPNDPKSYWMDTSFLPKEG